MKIDNRQAALILINFIFLIGFIALTLARLRSSYVWAGYIGIWAYVNSYAKFTAWHWIVFVIGLVIISVLILSS